MRLLNILLSSANAIAPIILLVCIGYFLKRKLNFSEDFFKTGNRLVFNIALPTMLFYNIYSVKDLNNINWNSVLFAVGVTLFLFFCGWLTSLLIPERRQKGVVWQCFYRANNAIIGIPLAIALGADSYALAILSILSAFCIFSFNILSVISLSAYTGTKHKKFILSAVMSVVTNPLFIAIMLGLLTLVIRSAIPVSKSGTPVFSIENNIPFLYKAIKMISELCSPLSLIILGGMFSFEAISSLKKQIAVCTVSRLVIAPFIGLLLAILLKDALGFGSAEFISFVAIFCPPVAVSSLAMASQMNNDDQLASQSIVWTTLFSVITVFIWVVILKSLNIL